MQVEPKINPYNFVPLDKTPVKREAFPGWHRIGEEAFSGRLQCHLIPLSALFSADHQNVQYEFDAMRRDKLHFLRDSQHRPILQGTTLKGMVRAIFEAITNSCLTMAATEGTSKKRGERVHYELALLGDHGHDKCAQWSSLCPACRLFGVIQGDEVHAQGRVAFSDAVLTEGKLETHDILLPELSTPKPHHYGIYAQSGSQLGPIAGRKFYYHHDPQKALAATGEGSPRAKWIAECAPVGVRFSFTVTFHNLSKTELATLVHSIVLDDGLGHKIGMAKPAGFGSCRIQVDQEKSFVSVGGDRYTAWKTAGSEFDLKTLKDQAGPLPDFLLELLKLDKYEEGTIGYLSYGAYRAVTIDRKGRYKTATTVSLKDQRPKLRLPLGESDAERKTGPAHQPEPKPKVPRLKPGDRVQIEVIAKEGRVFHLRIVETGQEDFLFQMDYAPWKVGTRQRVRVAAVGADGLVKKINP